MARRETPYTCLAVDLGASGGRVISGTFDGTRIATDQVHRFPNGPVESDGTLYWDFEGLMKEIRAGLRKGIQNASERGSPVRSIGIDSWGVDFGLVDGAGNLVAPPVHYRDERTRGVMESVFQNSVSREDIYKTTGIQFLPFNTAYQLVALKRSHPEQLERARHLLMMADLVQHRLTGKVVCEFTNATTTQLFDPRRGDWSDDLIGRLGLPRRVFAPVTPPGTQIGPFTPEVKKEVGGEGVRVIAVATHDTGSAVAAVPAAQADFAYLSCGTWSLLGTEVNAPVITDRALEYGLTNEGGVEGTYRLLKNIMGLWLLQECRAEWKRQGKDYSWDAMTGLAEQAAPFRSLIDPDDSRFLAPGDMSPRVQAFSFETGQPVPDTEAAVVRCILESLVLKYRVVLEKVEGLVGHRLSALHLVGGGIRNRLLCQWTAAACECRVVAGPVEATALGNLGVQLIAAGLIPGLAAFRRVVRESEPMVTYSPQASEEWKRALERVRCGLIPVR